MTFKYIDGATYVTECYLYKMMSAERRNGIIAGVIIGFIAGVFCTLMMLHF